MVSDKERFEKMEYEALKQELTRNHGMQNIMRERLDDLQFLEKIIIDALVRKENGYAD